MSDLQQLAQRLQQKFSDTIELTRALNEITIEVAPENLLSVCKTLRDDPQFGFDMLMDVCGIDYLYYGLSEWETTQAANRGFERGVRPIHEMNPNSTWTKPRLAAVYHLLSIAHNWRIRIRTFVPDETLCIPSVVEIWNSANWFEREAFDLYGILFQGHPDLRRILTDYGFIGHPFRKDFPLVGNVEVRYDAKQQRVIYEPVDIVPRTLVPKVIRQSENETQQGGE